MLKENLVRIILLMIVPMVIGYLAKYKIKRSDELSASLIKKLIIYLVPIISLIVFWKIELNFELILLPIIGIIITTLAGLVGFLFSRFHNLNRKQQGSYLAGAGFSNIGWAGGTMISYIFLGNNGLALAVAYNLFFMFYYYTIGFWLAAHYGNDSDKKPNLTEIFSNKLVYLPLLGIAAGIFLNLSSFNFPIVLQEINDYFILPILVIGAEFSIGLTLYIRHVWKCQYSKLVYVSISVIKFIITPVIGLLFAYLFRLPPLATTVIFIMSLMPAAESSMQISRIFKLDQDLANSNYLVTTFAAVFWSIGAILFFVYLLPTT